MVNIDDFKKLSFVVGEIKEVNEHPDADKLYLVKVDTGSEEKQLVAGIKGSYSKEELVGRQVVVVNNMQPATIRGQESQGMILAATDEEGIFVVSPDRKVKLGSQVK